ncbi:MAG: c-type cytochrome [Pseudomonadota bacterium]|nr:c-type cytochrome [Pseudomonadota bacterium]
MSRTFVVLILGYLLLAAGAVGIMTVNGMFAAKSSADNAERVARGEFLYMEHCAACHGADLKGEPNWETQRADRTYPAPPQDHTGHTWQHSDAELFDYIRDGGKRFERRAFKSTMDGFGDVMTSAEIWAVIAYLKSCWPKEFLAKQARANFLGGLHNH